MDQEHLREFVKRNLERWVHPATKHELGLVNALGAMPTKLAVPVPDEILEYMRMKPQECHQNAHFYATRDPDAHHVFGWRPMGDVFVLHSVIQKHGQLLCVTPAADGDHFAFPFIPDAKIEVVFGEEDRASFHRSGYALIGGGVRKDPKAIISVFSEHLAELNSGADPKKVVQAIENKVIGSASWNFGV